MNIIDKLSFIHSWVGLFHFITALLALLFGTFVLFNKKGTKQHRKMGYIYCINMVLLNLSGLGIYTFGGFSIFHAFALISLITLALGMIPAIYRKKDNWQISHFYFMSWSVVGLYAAFWAETGVRFFDLSQFWWVVLIATLLTTGIGAYVIKKEAKNTFGL